MARCEPESEKSALIAREIERGLSLGFDTLITFLGEAPKGSSEQREEPFQIFRQSAHWAELNTHTKPGDDLAKALGRAGKQIDKRASTPDPTGLPEGPVAWSRALDRLEALAHKASHEVLDLELQMIVVGSRRRDGAFPENETLYRIWVSRTWGSSYTEALDVTATSLAAAFDLAEAAWGEYRSKHESRHGTGVS